jgi:type 1 glutamine amidotransferase
MDEHENVSHRNCSITLSIMNDRLLVLIVILFFVLTSVAAVSQKSNRIPVLIVDGFSNHDWQQTTAVTKWILEQSGRFEVHTYTIPSDSIQRSAWIPDFKKYSVVIQNTNNIHNSNLRWSLRAERQLELYVKNGGGLYILHSGNNAFSHWDEYNKMIGLGWRPKSFGYALEIDGKKDIIRFPPGEGEGTGHGERFNAVIQIFTKHPINRNYPDQWQTANTEVYYFPRGPAENLTVLSYAYDSTSTHRMWPVEWVVAYGKGRVYNSSLGHLWKGESYPPAYRCVGYQTTVIEWLGTGEVTYPVPDDFPSSNTLSLKKEHDMVKPNKP